MNTAVRTTLPTGRAAPPGMFAHQGHMPRCRAPQAIAGIASAQTNPLTAAADPKKRQQRPRRPVNTGQTAVMQTADDCDVADNGAREITGTPPTGGREIALS